MEKFYWQPSREEVVNIVWQVRVRDWLLLINTCVRVVGTSGSSALSSPPAPPPPTHTHTQLYKEDGLSRADIASLVESYSNQSLDFFGALRAATYDGQIKEWMVDVAGE